jgi:hypothetical protein
MGAFFCAEAFAIGGIPAAVRSIMDVARWRIAPARMRKNVSIPAYFSGVGVRITMRLSD